MNAQVPLLGAARLRSLFAEHGVRPTKSLGQNFVIDPNTIRKTLVVADLDPDDRVLEVGPGAGSLTLGLASSAAHVVAVERDERLLPVLGAVLADADNVEVVHGDALEVSLSSYEASSLVANLPYNVAASVVLKVLEDAPSIRSLTVMVQKEVGERLAATPLSKTYGATSVLVAYFARARVAASVSRNAFWPPPNVDSVIVRIDRSPVLPDVDARAFFNVVKGAFSQRRKTVRNALASWMGSVEGAEDALRAAGIDPAVRAESLAPEHYVELAKQMP
jgi:16S rRNA (adenine1518-N6/adenine1519-N6)-dimethyltransferase